MERTRKNSFFQERLLILALMIAGLSFLFQACEDTFAPDKLSFQPKIEPGDILEEWYRATLYGRSVVPPVQTDATAHLQLRSLKMWNCRSLQYRLFIRDLDFSSIGEIHIHEGAPEENGRILIYLNQASWVNSENNPETGEVTFAFNVESSDPVGMNHVSFEEMLELIDDENTYIDVHTTRFPRGEIRGQIVR